jgi:transposase
MCSSCPNYYGRLQRNAGAGRHQAVDLRGSFKRLYNLVFEQLKADPLSDHLFVFTNGRGNRVKVFLLT